MNKSRVSEAIVMIESFIADYNALVELHKPFRWGTIASLEATKSLQQLRKAEDALDRIAYGEWPDLDRLTPQLVIDSTRMIAKSALHDEPRTGE